MTRPVRHGTYAGWNWHRAKGVPTCIACKEANRQYMAAKRAGSASQRTVDAARIKAGGRAKTRLKNAHLGEYAKYYHEELDALLAKGAA